MTVAINGATGTTTPGTTFTGSTSGSILIQAPATAGTNTLTLPANTGTIVSTGSSAVVTQAMLASSGIAGNGPAFSANATGTQTFATGVQEKVLLATELYDTNTDFSSSRFTPSVEGYYFVTASFAFSSSTDLAQYSTCYIQKNGDTVYLTAASDISAGTSAYATASGLIYCNGTTDYIELWGRATGSGTLTGNTYSYLSGFLARSA